MTGRVTVFAASSLTESFTRIGESFEQRHPGTDVVFSFGGSSSLATQIGQGAPADVFAAASEATMHRAVEEGLVGEPTTFAANRLQIAVPRGNPAGVTTLADFADRELTIALCAEQVPCGAAAAAAFAAAGVVPAPDTLEQDVKAALSKVVLGEVDAALVYRTDVRAATGEVEGIELPDDMPASVTYPIALLHAARDTPAAHAFVDHVLSADGQAVLHAAGFDPLVTSPEAAEPVASPGPP